MKKKYNSKTYRNKTNKVSLSARVIEGLTFEGSRFPYTQ